MDQVLSDYRDRLQAAISLMKTDATFTETLNKFTGDDFSQDVAQILVWFSGKDLMACLATRLGTTPGLMRNQLRDWVLKNPERALVFWPEAVQLRDELVRVSSTGLAGRA